MKKIGMEFFSRLNFIYEGEWKNNKMLGFGNEYCTDGRIEEIFKNDNFTLSLSKSKYYSSIKGIES